MTEALEPLKGLIHRVKDSVSRHRGSEHSGLRILREPRDAEIDIVAVHGLGAEGFSSWTTFDPKRSSKPKSWLEELLAQDVPNARIMTYGYMSDGSSYRYLVRNVLYGRALDLVKELVNQRRTDGSTRRPLFFIAHSLGGWIVKRALIISSEAADPELKDVELSTCGVAFFGTLSPGRPSSPSPLAHVIRRTSGLEDEVQHSRASRSVRRSMHGSLRGSIRSTSMVGSTYPQEGDVEWLENQLQAFKAITANLPRLSFHETKKSADGFIVDKGNSITGSDGTQIGLQATHSDLVKFRGRDDNYRTFIERFREMMDKAKTSGILEAKQKIFDFAAVHRLDYLTSNFNIPYELPDESSNTTPRERLMAQLDSILTPLGDATSLQVNIANLWGRPGTGKTTLARDYAEKHKDDISFVFWIYAESWETVIASYLEFASSLVGHYAQSSSRSRVENDLGFSGVDDMLKAKSIFDLDALRVKSVVKAVKDWLMRPENDKWLVVFDNVEPSLDIFDFVPLTLTGKIIFTSRDRGATPWGSELEVSPMTQSEALQLMRDSLGEDLPDDPRQMDAVANIARHYDYNPRSLSLAASTMRHKGVKADEYSTMLEARVPPSIVGSNIDQSPVTSSILRISSMLSTSIIPIALFTAGTHLTHISKQFASVFAEMKMAQQLGHLDEVLQNLLDSNFIQAPSSPGSPTSSQSSSSSFDSFILEPDARDYVRQSLTPAEQTDHAWLACNVCIDGIKQNELDSHTLSKIHDFGRVMAPHAKVCYDDWSNVLGERPDDDDVAWQVLGKVCMTQGALEQAIGCFELALKQGSKMDPIERIQTSLSLANLLTQAGSSQRSREVLDDIDIPSIDTALGFRVATARASAAVADGHLDQAEKSFEVLEQEQEETLGPTDINTVSTVQRLASTLEQLGRLEEARALYRRVYISYQNIFGQAHPLTLEALEDLAHISRLGNAIDEAESLYEQSVNVKTRTLGAEHPSTAHALQKLAIIDDIRCRYDAARAKYEKALDIMSRTLGRAHPLYTTTMENMALSARMEGHSLYEDTNDEITGPVRERSMAARSGAAVMRETKRRRAFEGAEKIYLEILELQRAARDLYSEEHVLATGSKLREMYEDEDFFNGLRMDKVQSLLGLLREGRRRGTV